jgi:hypothetical protein
MTPADEDHLRLLSTLYRIYGVLTILCSFIFTFHIAIGVLSLVDPGALGGPGDEMPPFFGVMFLLGGGFAFIAVLSVGIVSLFVARWLEQRRNWTACVVVSAVNCLNMPLGVALGVFTILVLVRETVRPAFTN